MKGKNFEDMACDWLSKNVYIIIKRNHRCKTGEIDIIAKKGDKFIAFEIKGNYTNFYGIPRERINNQKIERIRKCFLEYAISNSIDIDSLQIDAIAIYKDKIEHIPNISW